MSDVVASSDVAPVTDRRPVPRGVLPRGMQTWLMVALAMGIRRRHHRDLPLTLWPKTKPA